MVELARILPGSPTRTLYDGLRDGGAIPFMGRGRRKALEILPVLADCLKNVGLSFHQWANSHRLSAETAAKALHQPIKFGDVSSEAVHRAFYRDFHRMYEKAFPGTDLNERLYHPPLLPPERAAYRIVPEGTQYVAKIDGREDIRGIDGTPTNALKRLILAAQVTFAIQKIHALPARD